MVSKIVKRTPTKPPKKSKTKKLTPNRRQTATKRLSTPSKTNPTSVVIATINESFFTCRRRLVKIFSKIVRLSSTPTKLRRSPRKHGFIKLPQPPHPQHDTVLPPKSLFPPLPPLQEPSKKTIFLDLDETLIHSTPDPPPERYDFTINPTIDGETMTFYVLKRPGVEEFLSKVSSLGYEVVIFTAGLREYARLVVDEIDKEGVISHRLYRDSCREVEGKYVKDLACMGRDLWKCVIVDDNPGSFMFQPENAVQIRPFVDDVEDRELEKLGVFFEGVVGVGDVREAVKLVDRLGGGRFQVQDVGLGFGFGFGG